MNYFILHIIRKAVSRLTPVLVRHLPRVISRFTVTWLIIVHGAIVKVKVSDTKYWRSPLIQGGLEIPVEVQMENSSENQQALSKYKTVRAENYHNGKYVYDALDIPKGLY